jgi:hypothetical protein
MTTKETPMPECADLVIEGTVITLDPDRRLIRDGGVAVNGDRIVAVDSADEVRRRFEAAQTLGGRRRIVLPGLIDCHGPRPGRPHVQARLKLRANRRTIDLRGRPGALGEDVAVTDEWLARWSGEGQGRLRPYVHKTVIRAGRLVSRTRVVTDESPDRFRGVEQSIAEGEAYA